MAPSRLFRCAPNDRGRESVVVNVRMFANLVRVVFRPQEDLLKLLSFGTAACIPLKSSAIR